MKHEDGVAAVEFAIVGGLLLLLLAGLMPIVQTVLAYNDLSRATAEGLRYATHAQANPRPGNDDCPAWTRWPSANEVSAAVQASLQRPVSVIVEPRSPCRIEFQADRSQMVVTVTARVERDLGPLAGLANGLSAMFGSQPPFPNETIQLRATASGLKE